MAQPSATIAFGDRNRGLQAGIINGPVHHHSPPERSETPPKPSCAVPFRRDPDFVDRGTLIDQIRKKCFAPASRIALVGIGGVGKSQLAIEYCYQTADQSPETWVFWVHASNAARIEQSYRDIADQVQLSGRRDPQADVFGLVHDWLRNQKNGKWLLVLDNADDAAALSTLINNGPKTQTSGGDGARPRYFSSYLPQSKNGSVLLTSRTRSVASQLVEENDIIPVNPMDNADAQALLHKKLGEEVGKDGIAELAVALELMPLALVQAAAYIRQRAPLCSVRQYLEDFNRSDMAKTSLLNQEAGHLRRDGEAKNSVITTWQISFDHVRQVRPSAADLLSLMSFFDRQGIPQFLLDRPYKAAGLQKSKASIFSRSLHALGSVWSESDYNESSSRDQVVSSFTDDILMLRNYSFVAVGTDGATFEMHALVQLATRKWLEAHGYLEQWKQQYIKSLDMVLPVGGYEHRMICQTLFPHAKSVEAYKPIAEGSLQEWTSILHKAAWYAYRTGKYNEAERMLKVAISARKKILGEKHVITLESIGMLALTYQKQGRWKEAEELELQVIETKKRVLGLEHPNTLASMGNLASTYQNQGRWKEAEELGLQVIETKKRVLGLEHVNTLASMGNLVSTYQNQGRWKEAEELGLQVIETKKRVLGLEHPDTLTSMSNLASTYKNQGRWKEAEELGLQVIETRKRVLGLEHPNTLISIGNLASTYQNQGRWKEAEELGLQVIEAKKRVLGLEHPNTLASMGNLASTYQNQGRWKESEELGLQVIEAKKRVLGLEHPDTLTSMKNLATTLKSQGRDDEAISLMETNG